METTIIKVYDSTIKKMAKRARVVMSIDQGIAYVQHSSTGMATVFINGKEVGKMKVPGEGHFSI